MGGFHGGHSSSGNSSSGGYHGGHSSSGYSSSGGYHGGHSSSGHSSFGGSNKSSGYHYSYSSGNRHVNYSVNSIYVGSEPPVKKSRLRTYTGMIILGIFLAVLGLSLFLSLLSRRSTATITWVSTGHDYSGTYCVYDFEYQDSIGRTYQGYGDDDDFSFKVGNKYPIYYNVINHSKYRFDNKNSEAFVLLIFVGGVGAAIAVFSSIQLVGLKRRIQAIGDVNHDGEVNEDDLEYAEKHNLGRADGAYEGAKKATKENVYFEERRKIKCPFCDSLVQPDDRFCESCGAPLGRK